MSRYYRFALVTFIFFVSELSVGNTNFECYSCNSGTDPGCVEDGIPDEIYLSKCNSSTSNGCRKIDSLVNKITLDPNPTRRVVRQCANNISYHKGCFYKGGYGTKTYICECFQNQCNDASKYIRSIFVTAISIFVAFVFLR